MPRLPFVATLRATSWRDLAALAFAVFSFAAIGKLLAPAAIEPFLHGVGLMAPLFLLAAKDLAHAPQAWQRYRSARTLRARIDVLSDEALHLAVGARSQGVLPLAAVERCEKVDPAPRAWRRRHRVAQADTLSVTPFDTPNCVLVLKQDACVDILHYGVQRRLPRYLFLYLDRPQLLAASLGQRSRA